MPVKFQRETFDEWLADARFLLEDHMAEADATLGENAINLNHDVFIELDQQKRLYVITGRDEHRELVAYWIGMIATNIANKHVNTAYTIGYYVKKRNRGFTVVRLIKFVENYFKELGVRNLLLNTRTVNRMGDILDKLGYHKVEEIYTKVF